MKKLIIPLLISLIPINVSIAEEFDLSVLKNSKNIYITDVNKISIKNTLLRILKSCTVETIVPEIPSVTYKGIKLVGNNGTIIEAHIFPNSINNYMVKIFTTKDNKIKLHGKYQDYAYQLIAMLELKNITKSSRGTP